MGEDLRVTSRLVIGAADLTETFTRSSGPGGQGVNTTDSRVRLRLDLRTAAIPEDIRARLLASPGLEGGVVDVVASEFREQRRNREAARARMAQRLAAALRPTRRRKPTRPTRGSKQRRLDAKRRRSLTKQARRRPSQW